MRLRADHPLLEALTPEAVRRIMPAEHVDASLPPSVIFFGTDDPLLDGAKAYVEACQAAGVRSELHLTEDAGHGFFNRDPHFKRTLRAADDFLASLGLLAGPATIDADE